MTSKQIVLHDLIEKKYGEQPYGWPELEVVLLVARLAVLKEIDLIVNNAALPLDQAYEHLTSSSKQRKVVIAKREVLDSDIIKKAQALGKELFGHQGPASEEPLFLDLRQQLSKWSADLREYEPLAQTGKYPGLKEIQGVLQSLRKFVEEPNSLRFLRRFTGSESASELRGLQEDVHDLRGFYTNQRHSWETLREAVEELSQNRLQLEAHEEARPALQRMEEILAHPKPYGMLHEVGALTHTAKRINDQLVADVRGPAVAEIQGLVEGVETELDKVSASDALRATALAAAHKLVETAAAATSIAHITQARRSRRSRIRPGAHARLRRHKTAQPPPKREACQAAPRDRDHGAYWSNGFIENPDDAEEFLTKLRAEIEAALAAGERVQIK